MPMTHAMKLGTKMRYNEEFMLGNFTPQMIELHLADEDMAFHWKEIIDNLSILPKVPIVIHAPPNLLLKMEKRPLVDLATVNEKQRKWSLDVIAKTMDLLGELEADYIVIHPGGQTPEPVGDQGVLMNNLLGSLRELEGDYNTKEMLMENMPWHYWMWGEEERWYSNILQKPEEFVPLVEYMHVALDICHAYLAVEEGSNDRIFEFITAMGGRIKHVHLSDASAPDHEGLQFGEGDIELRKVFRKVLDMDVTAIPEIRGGHLNDREGMKEALGLFSSILLGRA